MVTVGREICKICYKVAYRNMHDIRKQKYNSFSICLFSKTKASQHDRSVKICAETSLPMGTFGYTFHRQCAAASALCNDKNLGH